jgi:hypothetical protein
VLRSGFKTLSPRSFDALPISAADVCSIVIKSGAMAEALLWMIKKGKQRKNLR